MNKPLLLTSFSVANSLHCVTTWCQAVYLISPKDTLPERNDLVYEGEQIVQASYESIKLVIDRRRRLSSTSNKELKIGKQIWETHQGIFI